MVAKFEVLPRRVARVYRRFCELYESTFEKPYRGDLASDAQFLIHHVEADCAGRVAWAISSLSVMIEDAGSQPGTFGEIWTRWHLEGFRGSPAALRRERAVLRRMVEASALAVTERAAARRRVA